ncbi:hypothetical protein JTB14_024838 [Gonioctena quinquepunctata]|nr:hypothetical protein JTB14_024838 [Gonioctena quinquepunctata]
MGKVLDGDSVISAEKEIDLTDTIHGAVPDSHLKMSTADHQPYDVLVYNLDYSDALNAYSEVKHRPRDTKAYQNTYSVSEDSILEHGEFSSVENDEKGNLNQGTEYLETSGFEPLSSVTSINLEDPKQIETIRTQSYHREVPYDIGNFQTNQHDGEGHAEIHYHEHKHLHKHNHKQDHLHKHRQEHSHKHGHAHEDRRS